MKYATKTTKEPSLTERIEAVRAECEQFIDDKTAEIKTSAEGVPAGVIRGMLLARSGACVCRAVLNLAEGDQ